MKEKPAREGWSCGLLGSTVPQLRLLEPDGVHDAGTQMERIRHVRHTSLRIHSVPLLPPRQNEESQGDSRRWPDPWDLQRAIGWLEGDHNRHVKVPGALPITLSAIVGHQGNQLVNLGNKDPVLGNCPRQPYLLLALSVLGFLPA